MNDEQYKEVWGEKDCPSHQEGVHKSDLPAFTFKCICGKEPNFEALSAYGR